MFTTADLCDHTTLEKLEKLQNNAIHRYSVVLLIAIFVSIAIMRRKGTYVINRINRLHKSQAILGATERTF